MELELKNRSLRVLLKREKNVVLYKSQRKEIKKKKYKIFSELEPYDDQEFNTYFINLLKKAEYFKRTFKRKSLKSFHL